MSGIRTHIIFGHRKTRFGFMDAHTALAVAHLDLVRAEYEAGLHQANLGRPARLRPTCTSCGAPSTEAITHRGWLVCSYCRTPQGDAR